MEKVFAEIGNSFQQIGGDCPADWIEMVGQRPGLYNIAQADGSWGPEPRNVPQSCTRRQGRLALLSYGLIDEMEAHIEAIADPVEKRAAQIEYEADTWERQNPFVIDMWSELGGTSETLDDIFILASEK